MTESKNLQKILVSILALMLALLFINANIFKHILVRGDALYDFDSYRVLIENIKNGVNPYSPGLTFTLGPPLVFLYFFPFSYLSVGAARTTATLINIAAGFILCFILSKTFVPKKKLITFLFLSLLFFSSFLPRYSLGMGQPAILVSLLIGIIVTSNKNYIKGALLGILVGLKTVYLFSFLSIIKNKTAVKIFLLTLMLLLLTSLLFIKPEWYIYYFQHTFPNINNAPLAVSGLDYYDQSLKAVFFRLQLNDVYQLVFIPIVILISAVIFLTQSFELSIVATLLLSSVSWQHYLVSFFPIFVWIFFKMERRTENLILLSISFFLWWVDIPWLQTAPSNLVGGIIGSHFFISGVILYILILRFLKKSRGSRRIPS